MANVYQIQVDNLSNAKIFLLVFVCSKRFFQRMGIFAIYFTISLLALIVRGYYRVPGKCLRHIELDKDDPSSPRKTMVSNETQCQCHYSNFLWHSSFFDEDDGNKSILFDDNLRNSTANEYFEPTALVKRKSAIDDSLLCLFF